MPQRTTHQFQLSDSEFDRLYELTGLQRQVSKSVALRTVLDRFEEQVSKLTQLDNELKKMTENEDANSNPRIIK